MQEVDATVALQGAAQALEASARLHKTQEAQHRREARRLQRQLEQLAADCAALGVELHLHVVPDTDL